MRSRWLVLGFLVACGGGEDARRPAAPADGGSSTGGSRPTGGSKSAAEAGEAGEAPGGAGAGGEGEGGAGGDPIIYEMGGVPQNMPGICNPTMKLGRSEAQDVGVQGASLLSLSSDELSLAFSAGSGDTLTLYVADRPEPGGAFTQLIVPVPAGYSVGKGASLSSDGLRLVLPREDFSGFGELSRSKRGEAFGLDADETRFAKLNAVKPMSGESVAWPVQSVDGKALYFVSYFGQALVKRSTLGASGVFSIGADLEGSESTLGGEPGEYKRISGLASDERAIFFFDEATGQASALFRSRPDAPFYEPVELGVRLGVAPNTACTRLYSSTEDGIVAQTVE